MSATCWHDGCTEILADWMLEDPNGDFQRRGILGLCSKHAYEHNRCADCGTFDDVRWNEHLGRAYCGDCYDDLVNPRSRRRAQRDTSSPPPLRSSETDRSDAVQPSRAGSQPPPQTPPREGTAKDPPLIRELLALHARREIEPDHVRMGPLPRGAQRATRAIAADIELRFGLLLAEGVTRALLYARSEAVRAGHARSERAASYNLRALCDSGFMRCVGEAPKRGKGHGTKLYVPPGWRPEDPEAFAAAQTTDDRLALMEMRWIPDDSDDVPVPVREPGAVPVE